MASDNEAEKRNLSMTTNAIILIILLILFLLVLGEIIQSDKGKSNFWRKLDAAINDILPFHFHRARNGLTIQGIGTSTTPSNHN